MSCSSTISCLGCLSLPLKEEREKEAHIHTVWTFIPNSSSPHPLHCQVQPATKTCFQAQWSLLLSWLYLEHFFFFGPEKSDSLQALKQQKRMRGSPWKMNFQLLKPGLVILAGEALAFKCEVYTHSHYIYSVNRWLTHCSAWSHGCTISLALCYPLWSNIHTISAVFKSFHNFHLDQGK